jgi:hypothetical protein
MCWSFRFEIARGLQPSAVGHASAACPDLGRFTPETGLLTCCPSSGLWAPVERLFFAHSAPYIGWIVNERPVTCEKCRYLKDCASTQIGNSPFGVARSRKKGPALCRAKGRRFLGGTLRSAAENSVVCETLAHQGSDRGSEAVKIPLPAFLWAAYQPRHRGSQRGGRAEQERAFHSALRYAAHAAHRG